jgi:hypothetical protein
MRLLPGLPPYRYTDRWVSVWRHPILWRKAGKMMDALFGAAARRPVEFLLVSPLGHTITTNSIDRALLHMRHGWLLVKREP